MDHGPPGPGETPEEAFRHEHPDREPRHLWYELGITDDSAIWLMPRFGGTDTEQMLTDLASAAEPRTTLKWAASKAMPPTGNRSAPDGDWPEVLAN